VDAQGIWLGGRHLAPVKNSLAGLRALLLNNRVDSVRLLVDASLVEEGLPCQAFTQLTLWQAPEQDLKQALFWLSRLAPYAQRVRADARLQQAFSIKHADFGWIEGPSGQDKEF
jgi:hypothetical protein